MISIPTVLSGASSSAAGHAAGKGASGKASLRGLFDSGAAASGSFASLFGQLTGAVATSGQSGTQTSGSSGSSNADLVTQLAAQLQAGTPLATIVDRIAQSVGQAAAKQLQGKYSASDIDRLRNSITQTIANALSPPSNAPPGTAAEEAATLAARLQQVVESLARDAENGAGQQNELSGTILDAKSAKDIPAQQKTSGTSSASALNVPAVVRSLLVSALSAISAAAPASQSAVASTAAAALQPASAAPVQSPVPASSGTTATTYSPPSGSIAMANAPDVLARMLVRAAGADAAINGTPASAAASDPSTPSSLPSPSVLAARFAALLGEDASAPAAASGSDGDTQGSASDSGNAGRSFGQLPQPANVSAGVVAANAVMPGATMASQVQNALANPPAAAATVDTSAIVEQLVKGMVMRTDSQGTSEIRLQLQPESLGAVTMRLTVSGSQISANLVAQNADARNTIVAAHQELARSLESAGLTLSGFSVDVSGGDAGNDQNKDRTAGFGRRFIVHESNGAQATETANDTSSGPPLLGSSGLDLFNYLA